MLKYEGKNPLLPFTHTQRWGGALVLLAFAPLVISMVLCHKKKLEITKNKKIKLKEDDKKKRLNPNSVFDGENEINVGIEVV
jgi:hypothetical protein